MKKCECGRLGSWQTVNGQIRFICNDCLEAYDYVYCEKCEEYHNEEYVEYVESHNQWMCETCRGDL